MKKLLFIGLMCFASFGAFAKANRNEVKDVNSNYRISRQTSCTQTVTVTYTLPNGVVLRETQTFTATSTNPAMLCSLARTMAAMTARSKIEAFLSAAEGPELFYTEQEVAED
ncbi:MULTISPECIES: hypothetical protein [unclassified Pedobacter]|uniref:hypothetical protein n=1 Tax=unclassified Pedobacter TaxID=2628915 RepID=UPI001E2DC84D|nr:MULTISPECIES: hypothetical protein [unclassified Pedobacter]